MNEKNELQYEAQQREDAVYETPEVQTFSPDELLEVLGPAQGYGGGSGPGRRGGVGRGHRLFPGIR